MGMWCRATQGGDSVHTETEWDRIERPAPGLTCGAKGKAGTFFAVPEREELQGLVSSLARATHLHKLSGRGTLEHSSCTTDKRRHER